MSYSELRANDMRVEREIARFLDSHVYNKESLFLNPRRTDTLDWQFKGCDIIVDVPSLGLQNVIVDEKTQGHYLLKPLPTFALELSFLNKNNELMEGWFTDKSKATQYYMFLWITASEDDRTFTSDKVTDVKFAFVSRQKILDYLESNGYGYERLREMDSLIRISNPNGGAVNKTPYSDFWFYYTTNLKEKPINIVLRQRLIYSLSVFYYDFKR